MNWAAKSSGYVKASITDFYFTFYLVPLTRCPTTSALGRKAPRHIPTMETPPTHKNLEKRGTGCNVHFATIAFSTSVSLSMSADSSHST